MMQATTTMLTPGFETCTLLSSIYSLTSINEIGSTKFMIAYCINLERLCIQAHSTAACIANERSTTVNIGGSGRGGGDSGGKISATPGLDDILSITNSSSNSNAIMGDSDNEEYIVNAFLQNVDKIETLVKTLLMIELWRENVLFGRQQYHRGCAGQKKSYGNATAAENDVEFEIEGGHREEDECYNELNDVDGGNDVNGSVITSTIGEGEEEGLAHRLANNGNALRTAFILHAETTIVSLLSLIFYKGIPAELLEGGSNGDDVLLSLIDYCARQLIFLGTPTENNPTLHRQKNPMPATKLSAYLQSRSRIKEIEESMHDATYQTAIASVTLSRYICENINELNPSLLSRVLEVHDFPLLMIPLIDEPPWTRRRMVEQKRVQQSNTSSSSTDTMIWEKLNNQNEWKEVQSTDLLNITQLEGQPWLAIWNLTTSKVFRESYGIDEYRKSQLMRLRKYIHEALIDQLPVLGDVARYLDELSILGVPPSGQGVHRPSSNASASGLLLQRVDLVRESIVGGKGSNILDDEYWKGVAQMQWEAIFSHVTDSTDEELRRIATEVYGGDDVGLADDDDDDVMAAMNTAASSATIGSRAEFSKKEEVDEPQPIDDDDDWKVALSKPIEKVVLDMQHGDGNSLASFELRPQQNCAAAVTDTPLGPFRRSKMSIVQTKGEGEAIYPHAKVVAGVYFEKDDTASDGGAAEDVTLSIESLVLPTVEHGTSQSTYDAVGIELPTESFPSSKEWRQLGDVEKKTIVLQLGFKRLSRGVVPAGESFVRGYSLSNAFLSQPLVR